ncbi:hypothetical protein PMAYCL1PPCAC_28926, partial [Pristionchus mayeri]
TERETSVPLPSPFPIHFLHWFNMPIIRYPNPSTRPSSMMSRSLINRKQINGSRLPTQKLYKNPYKLDRRPIRPNSGPAKEFVSRVKIPHGAKYGAAFILSALSQEVENFLPMMSRMTGDEFTFFLRDKDSADAIRSMSGRIKHPKTGHKLTIFVNSTVAPWVPLKKEETEAIKKVIASRADQKTRALDLSEFATHEVFKKDDLMFSLTKSNVFLAVVEMIESDYSNINALSFKGNRIKYLEVASMLPFFAKNLKVLDLSDNQISSISELEKLKGIPLTTLFLENNPICEQYSKASDYLRFSPFPHPITDSFE